MTSQRKLQTISRESESALAIRQHDQLMDTYYSDMSQVCAKLKKICGDKLKSMEIPFIETICGTYEGVNVLEGFRSTQKVVQWKVMWISRTKRILPNENVNIPHMQLSDIKDILFRRLKLNKACDIYKLTVEQLIYCGDETLCLILQLLNLIIDNLNYLSSPKISKI